MAEAQPLLPDVDFAHAELPDLHAVLDELRGHGSVVPVVYHNQKTWLILAHEELSVALADDETFPSADMYVQHTLPVLGKTLQCMRGEEHRRNRALVSHAFRPTVIAKAVETMIEPLAHEVLDAIAPRGEADLVEEYAHPFPCKVILRLLGIPMRDEQRTLHWAIKLIELPWDPEGAIAASREFTSYLGPLVAQRRAEPTDDLISELAAVEIDGDRLDDEAIFSFARLLFPAGSDTTYKNLGSLLATVLRHPEIERLAREQPNRIPAIVEEGLRFESPVALLPRWCSKDVLLGGVHIPANSPVLFGIAAANRDPAVFPDPHRFDPERQLRASLAFGHGLHFCLGSHLARRELEVALAAALDRLPGLHLTDPENVQILDAVFRGPRELRVRFEARPGS